MDGSRTGLLKPRALQRIARSTPIIKAAGESADVCVSIVNQPVVGYLAGDTVNVGTINDDFVIFCKLIGH